MGLPACPMNSQTFSYSDYILHSYYNIYVKNGIGMLNKRAI